MDFFSYIRIHSSILLFAGVLLILLGFGGYQYLILHRENTVLSSQAEEARQTLASSTLAFESSMKELEDENEKLAEALEEEQDRNDAFEKQIKKISGTVGTLEKLSKTDPELLQKYSKVFFLNENYIPSKLVEIDSQYLYNKDKPIQIHGDVRPFLEDLLDDAADDKVTLQIISGYRSFGTQSSLKSSYTVTYGTGANTFSADQGYSEHQLGTTIDFTTPTVGATFVGFENTSEYQWLQNNAYKYGFILSYPAGNTYYQFEPWHWRFVGTNLARKLHRDNMHFYDLDQREIDKYLVSIFD